LDGAGAIIDYVSAQVSFPEIDIRQRLTVSRGYDVAELTIPLGSEFIGKTLAASGLSERDINVLSLHRAGKVVPNPKASRELEAGDRLLCFGKVATMRELIPEKSRRRRKPKIRALSTVKVGASDPDTDTSNGSRSPS
jgi:ribosomal protein S6--L-glutamate ligase